jgi:hypothetical protein
MRFFAANTMTERPAMTSLDRRLIAALSSTSLVSGGAA